MKGFRSVTEKSKNNASGNFFLIFFFFPENSLTTRGLLCRISSQMEEICAKNTEWIFGLSLSTRFLQEPETTDRSNGRNAKAETLNSFLL